MKLTSYLKSMKLICSILFFSLFFLSNTYAQTASLTANKNLPSLEKSLFEGRFKVQEGDAPELVKGMLLRQAMLAAVVKELKTQNLNSSAFLKKLDNLFLKEAEGVSERPKRLALLVPFGNLTSALLEYEIKEEGILKDNPNERYIRLSGKADPEAIKNLYYTTMREGESFRFSSLILIPEIEMVQMNLNDIFVENVEVLYASLGDSWKKWLGDNFSKLVPEIRIGNKELELKINSDLKQSKRSLEFEGALYLRLKCRLEKVKDNSALGERDFVLKGEFALLDMNSTILVASGNINEKRFTAFVHGENPASQVASEIYRFPLVSFVSLPKKLEEQSVVSQKMTLPVHGAKGITKILSLIRLLESQGTGLKLKASLQVYSVTSSTLELTYQGENESVAKFIKGLGQKLTDAGDLIEVSSTTLALELKVPGGK